jgi:hypothetical protein
MYAYTYIYIYIIHTYTYTHTQTYIHRSKQECIDVTILDKDWAMKYPRIAIKSHMAKISNLPPGSHEWKAVLDVCIARVSVF